MRINGAIKFLVLIGIILGVLLFVPFGSKEKMDLSFKKEGTLNIFNPSGTPVATFDIQLAETEEEQEQGLMYRESLGEQQGMLFLMEEEEVHSFWMLDTYISLDIIFVAADKEIVYIAKNTEPESQEPITSMADCLYVLEINGGTSERFGIKVGDRIEF